MEVTPGRICPREAAGGPPNGSLYVYWGGPTGPVGGGWPRLAQKLDPEIPLGSTAEAEVPAVVTFCCEAASGGTDVLPKVVSVAKAGPAALAPWLTGGV